MNNTVMTIEEARRTQRPYRYGMILLCFGALANWLGLAENYAEPVRYLGVACIIAGALLICTAMCCWLHTPQRNGSISSEEGDNSVNVITVSSEIRCEKPPEYDTVASLMPPSYDDAIKLNPSLFLATVPRVASSSTASGSTSTSAVTAAAPVTSGRRTQEQTTTTTATATSTVVQVIPQEDTKEESSSSAYPSASAHISHPPPSYVVDTYPMPNEAVVEAVVMTYDDERRRCPSAEVEASRRHSLSASGQRFARSNSSSR